MGNKKRDAAWDKRKWVAINVGIGYAVRTRDNRSFVVCVSPDMTDDHVKDEIEIRLEMKRGKIVTDFPGSRRNFASERNANLLRNLKIAWSMKFI